MAQQRRGSYGTDSRQLNTGRNYGSRQERGQNVRTGSRQYGTGIDRNPGNDRNNRSARNSRNDRNARNASRSYGNYGDGFVARSGHVYGGNQGNERQRRPQRDENRIVQRPAGQTVSRRQNYYNSASSGYGYGTMQQKEEERTRKNRPVRQSPKRKKKPKRIVKYRKPWKFNLGILVYGIIAIYVCACIITYAKKEHVVIYEVKKGSLAQNNTYTGLILRDETIIKSGSAGYVNYFAREGEKAGANTLVYTIDENGTLSSAVAQSGTEVSTPSKEELQTLRNDIMNFSSSFQVRDFSDVYNFKYTFDSSVLKVVGLSVLNSIESYSQTEGTAFERGTAPTSGIVEYYTDGYEKITIDNFTEKMFDKTSYEKTIIKNNDLVDKGAPVYKLLTDEKWKIVIPLDKETAKDLEEKSSINIVFKRDGQKAKAGLSLLEKDGSTYGVLSMKKSLLSYASERYVDIELALSQEEGLKIPVSSVVEKEFYLIPEEYAKVNSDTQEVVFLKEATKEDGTLTTVEVVADIYSLTDGEYYVSTDQFESGQYILKADSADKYAIGKKASLTGVYNINKGFADFKEITKLYENDEYCIVQANSTYGLAVYDHIVLDADAVKDDQIIY